jgi:hypothetical protein
MTGGFFMKKMMAMMVGFLILISLNADFREIDLPTNSQEISVSSSDYSSLKVRFSYDKLHTMTIETEKGKFNELFIPQAYSIGELGEPKLPAFKKLIEIPFGAEINVKSVHYEEMEMRLADFQIENQLFPMQPSLPKNVDMKDVAFEYSEKAYSQNRFNEHQIVTVEILGVMRGVRIARLIVAPIFYNPIQNDIRLLNDIEVELSFSNVNTKENEHIKKATYSPYFKPVYAKLLNRVDHDYPAHPDLVKYPVKYLIVSDRMFESTLQPFIEWKTKKGFEVIVGYTDTIGSSVANIQTWVHNRYNEGTPADPAPSFVLFVGDTAQIPASATGSSSGQVTDLYYCSTDGDMFPEMYWGRFSATSTAQLQPIIDKTLYYEQYQFADPSYLDNVTLIAGVDGTWNPNVGQATIQYGTQNYFNAAHGFNQVNAYLSSYTNCYNTINTGVGFINYTAHGSTTSWADPSFSVSQVHALTNVNKPTMAVGNCCVTGQFSVGECFGESWTRADNGGIGYIGSAPNTYWFEDFYWSVGAFPISGENNGYVPTYDETTWGAYDAPFHSDYLTNDALKFIGNLSVTEVDIQGYPQHSSPLYYWQAYSLFGDPSIVTYLTQGDVNTVSFEPILPIGSTEFTVNAEPGSHVAISMNGVLHGAALVDASGSVDVPITPFTTSGTADIVVTKPQYQPEITTVTVAPLSGPYVSIDSHVVSSGGDSVIEFGEIVYLTVTLKNVGSDAANSVSMSISESDSYVTLNDSSETFGNIAAGASVTRTSAFQWTMANSVPDEHDFSVNSTITCTGDSWTPSMNFTAYRPDINVSQVAINDGDNGRLDPGETADVIVTLENAGGAQANSINAVLSSADSYITINNGNDTLAQLAAGGSNTVTFNITVSGSAPVGHSALFNVGLTAHNSYSNSDSFSQTIGLNLEDFESGDFSSYAWSHSGDGNWTIDTTLPYEGTNSAKSGTITDSQASNLVLTADVSAAGDISFYKKVSSESGYDFLRFYIDDVQQGQWAGTVAWSQETYSVAAGTHTFRWTYSKDGSVSSGDDCAWIDYIVFPSFGASAPSFSVSPTSLAYGNVYVGQNATQSFTITNSGGAALSGNITTPLGYSITARSNCMEKSKTRATISYNIGANSSQTFDITFAPAAVTSYNGNITITSNDSNHPTNTVAVTGAGINPPTAVITPASFTPTLQPEGTSSEALNIFNTGGANLTYEADFIYVTRSRETIMSEGFENGGVIPTGWTQEFVTGSVSWIYTNGGHLGYPSSAHGGSYNAQLYYGSSSSNYLTKLVSPEINLNNYTNTQLSFYHAMADWSGDQDQLKVYYKTSASGSWTLLQEYTTDTPDWTLRTITLPNVSSTYYIAFEGYTSYGYGVCVDDVLITGDIEGPSYTWLSLNGQPSVSGTVTPGNNTNIPVNFDAAGLELGAYEAQINVTTNDPSNSSSQIPVTLTISSGGVPQISVNPTSINFGDVEIGSTSSEPFTITNNGTGVLSGSITTPDGYAVEVAAKEFSVNSKKEMTSKDERDVLNYSVNAGSAKTFNLIFEPLAEQSYNDDVVITNNVGSNVIIAVTGNGVPAPTPEIVVNPTTLSATMDTNETTSQNLTIENIGEATLSYSANISYNPTAVKSSKEYCASTYSNSGIEADDWIANVTFNTINNTTSYEATDSYGDYTAISAEVTHGENYQLCVTLGFEASFYTQHVRVWIDWDQNGTFNTDESYYLGTVPNDGVYQVCLDISVPADAVPGNTGMRIIEQYNTDPGVDGACDGTGSHSTTYGETEDYTIVIVEDNPMSWLTLNGNESYSSSVNQSNQEIITVGFDSADLEYGTYTANIIITSDDPANPEETISVTLNVEEVSGPSWTPVIYPNNSTTLYGLVTINDVAASAGDKVGVFVDSECRSVGDVVINEGSAYVTMVIQVSAPLEEAIFRVWDASADIIYEAGNTAILDIGSVIGYPPNYFEINAHDNFGQTVENEIENLDPIAFAFDAGENSVTITPPVDGNPDGGELVVTRLIQPPANMPNPDCVLPLWYNIDASNYSGGYPVTVTFVWDSPNPVSDEEPVLIFSTDNGETWLFADTENGVTIQEWDLVNTDGDNYSVTFVSDHFSQWVMGDGSDSPILLPSPLNVTIQTTITEITLNWQAVSGATSYVVYSATDPSSGFLPDESGVFDGTTWTAPFGRSSEKKFYYVKAVK